jgi:hypothetical protein
LLRIIALHETISYFQWTSKFFTAIYSTLKRTIADSEVQNRSKIFGLEERYQKRFPAQNFAEEYV